MAYKLLFYREGRSEKHLDDVRAMLASEALPDLSILQDWLTRLDLEKEWSEVVSGGC